MKVRQTALAALVLLTIAVSAGFATTGTAAPKPPQPPARSVYVISTSNANVVRIDPTTLQVVETIELAGGFFGNIAVAGGRLYYTNYDAPGGAVIGRYDLSTAVDNPVYISQATYAPILRTAAALPDVLFVGEAAQSPSNIQKWSVPSAKGRKPSLLAKTEHGPLGGNLGDFAISADGSKVWSADGAMGAFLELSSSDLRLTGRSFPAVAYPNSIDTVVAGGKEWIVGATYSPYETSVHLYDAANPASRVDYGANGTSSVPGGVGLSPDASKIYRVVDGFDGSAARIETLSAGTGAVLGSVPVNMTPNLFYEGMAVDRVTGNVFVTLTDSVGVFDSGGALVRVIPNVAGAQQVVIG